MVFQGFDNIEEESIPIPKELIDKLMGEIRSLAELKVTLFVIRHTYSENVQLKCIGLSDFLNGIKNAGGNVIGGPVGLAKQHILNGIALAEKRNSILVYREKKKGRDKKWFFLNTPENRAIYHALERNALSINELIDNGQNTTLGNPY